MALIVQRKIYGPQLEEGWHDATIKSVTAEYGVSTPFGVKDQAKFIFTVRTEDGEVELSLKCNLVLSPKSRLFKLVTDLTGAEPGETVDLEDLIGLRCQIFVSHKELDSGDIWENIDRVRKRPALQRNRAGAGNSLSRRNEAPADEAEAGLPF